MKPNYKKIYNFVKKKFEKTKHFSVSIFDETYFTLRVYKIAKEIISKLDSKVKKEAVLVASLLHDVGKVKINEKKVFNKEGFVKNHRKEWDNHPSYSVEIAQEYLKKKGFSEEFINDVSYLIKNHDSRKLSFSEKTLELKILQDADLLADVGLSGFIRVFLYSGKFDRSIIESIKFLEKEDRTLGGEELNLNISKKIGKREMKIQKELTKRMRGKINSDLI